MNNLNKVLLIGRLTREPEVGKSVYGGAVAKLGFAVHNRRRNAVTGEWQETPVWLNLKAYSQEGGTGLAEEAGRLHRGEEVLVEGRLAMQGWTGPDRRRHTRLLVHVDAIGSSPRVFDKIKP